MNLESEISILKSERKLASKVTLTYKLKSYFDISLLMILWGAFILAFAYYHFNFQSHLVEGGFVGLSLLGKYVFNFSPSATILTLSLPFFLFELWKNGIYATFKIVLGTAAFSFFYHLMEMFSPLQFDMYVFLAAILSGVISGYGIGLVIRHGGVTGGEDLLCIYLSKWLKIKIGTAFIMIDLIVLTLSLFFLPITQVLYTILAVAIASRVITWTTHGVSQKWKRLLTRSMR